MLGVIGLFRSASGVKFGASISGGGEYTVFESGDEDAEDDGVQFGPRMRDISFATV